MLPEPAGAEDTGALTAALHAFLDPRRILTVRHHVVLPEYVDVTVAADLAPYADVVPEDALADAVNRLREFYDPLIGGEAGDGWPFGRSVHPSEVYAVLERSPLADHIENVRLTRAGTDADAGTDGIALDAHQLVRLTRVDLVGYGSYGRTYPSTWELPR